MEVPVVQLTEPVTIVAPEQRVPAMEINEAAEPAPVKTGLLERLRAQWKMLAADSGRSAEVDDADSRPRWALAELPTGLVSSALAGDDLFHRISLLQEEHLANSKAARGHVQDHVEAAEGKDDRDDVASHSDRADVARDADEAFEAAADPVAMDEDDDLYGNLTLQVSEHDEYGAGDGDDLYGDLGQAAGETAEVVTEAPAEEANNAALATPQLREAPQPAESRSETDPSATMRALRPLPRPRDDPNARLTFLLLVQVRNR